MPLEVLVKLLARVPVFTGLSAEQLERIAGLAQVRAFPARAVVVSQGEPAEALFAIIHGRLKVVSSGPDGRDTVLGIMAPGEVFGEVALLDGGTRSATCTAMEACELLVIERTEFFELLVKSPEIAVRLLQVLAGRLRRLSERSEDAAFLDVESRLARAIVGLSVRFGERGPAPKEILVALKLSQQELGDLVDATRESINKHLADWTRQGILRVNAGRLTILDLPKLRQLARMPAE